MFEVFDIVDEECICKRCTGKGVAVADVVDMSPVVGVVPSGDWIKSIVIVRRVVWAVVVVVVVVLVLCCVTGQWIL